MLRVESATGWGLTTHPDHARLAAAFAAHWGNDLFAPPEPATHVLHGIAVHDDGWVLRDAEPQITRQGLPGAFSSELVGKYSAFEEIDLPDYLAVRDRAVNLFAESDAYAAILVSMHTYNLLTERADRATIRAAELPLLDAFLEGQLSLQTKLFSTIQQMPDLSERDCTREAIEDNFRLLQAVDNLSLLSCVNYRQPATLLHPLRLVNGDTRTITVEPVGDRIFRLHPYPFKPSPLTIDFPIRFIEGRTFPNADALQQSYTAAELQRLSVTIHE